MKHFPVCLILAASAALAACHTSTSPSSAPMPSPDHNLQTGCTLGNAFIRSDEQDRELKSAPSPSAPAWVRVQSRQYLCVQKQLADSDWVYVLVVPDHTPLRWCANTGYPPNRCPAPQTLTLTWLAPKPEGAECQAVPSQYDSYTGVCGQGWIQRRHLEFDEG